MKAIKIIGTNIEIWYCGR